jgi:hypothetical protein
MQPQSSSTGNNNRLIDAWDLPTGQMRCRQSHLCYIFLSRQKGWMYLYIELQSRQVAHSQYSLHGRMHFTVTNHGLKSMDTSRNIKRLEFRIHVCFCDLQMHLTAQAADKIMSISGFRKWSGSPIPICMIENLKNG